MVELTGNFQGTGKKDSYMGKIKNISQLDISGFDGDFFTGIAADDLTIRSRGGNDFIKAVTNFTVDFDTYSGPSLSVGSIGIGMQSADIKMGKGRDNLSIASKVASINRSNAIGLSESSIDMGSGRDIVDIKAFSTNLGFVYFPNVKASGVANSTLDAGKGDDTVNINTKVLGKSLRGNSYRLSELSAYGVDQGTILGGEGSDVINISTVVNLDPEVATDEVQSGVRTIAVGIGNGSTVNGGDNDDTINIKVSVDRLTAPSGGSVPGIRERFIGVYGGSKVYGGAGNDSISIEVTRDASQTIAVGVNNSRVSGGSGDDRLYIRGVNLDLDDALITGGNGKDIFNTGIGEATISGGKGTDLIKLNFFDSDTMSIELLGENSIQITGTQDKLGNSDSWTQTINDVEQYSIGGKTYNAAKVVNVLS